jgi:hypothetical protein
MTDVDLATTEGCARPPPAVTDRVVTDRVVTDETNKLGADVLTGPAGPPPEPRRINTLRSHGATAGEPAGPAVATGSVVGATGDWSVAVWATSGLTTRCIVDGSAGDGELASNTVAPAMTIPAVT